MRVLPADVYDTLELVAFVHGGIDRDSVYGDDQVRDDCPGCVIGLAAYADGCSDLPYGYTSISPFMCAVRCAFGGEGEISDSAVERINNRSGPQESRRVPFKNWCAELGVVRGDE